MIVFGLQDTFEVYKGGPESDDRLFVYQWSRSRWGSPGCFLTREGESKPLEALSNFVSDQLRLKLRRGPQKEVPGE
jgi:hypothetical protein